ncbi:MAG: retroviral-like aspartic protease family protein [Pseudomonadales bacterium]|nr:retroviral-like aspartic protease family protein [Pseudomonadales bacterium]MCP5184971.1 retroviral-like aspartic protease family protein [Pseudomonadales bacterium]
MLRRLICLLGLAVLSVAPARADEHAAAQLPLIPAASGAYYVNATFGHAVHTELLVDTGSSYVGLSERTFRKLKEDAGAAYVRAIRGRTAAGRVVNVAVYAIPMLTLGRHCVLRDVEAVVLPGADRDILGLSALRHLQPFSMALEPPTLSVSSCAPGASVQRAAATVGS